MLKVGIVAGESSGDQLGAQLIRSLKSLKPDAAFYGMCGPKMREAGCHALADVEQLSVMGIVEVARKYPQLRRLRSRLIADLLSLDLDIFIGIDVPDFVHHIEGKLKQAGVKTVHYVAPQVWAWRPGRAKRLNEIVDLLLVLFPFEPDFFTHYGVNTSFVGHPLVSEIPNPVDRLGACQSVGVEPNRRYVALMPGSRGQERRRHTRLFGQVANALMTQIPDCEFLLGAVHDNAAAEIRTILDGTPMFEKTTVVVHKSHEILAISDAALVVSGTVTMEALVSKTPMVVAIRVAGLSYQILKRMVKTPFIAMPNVLAEREIVPEFVQDEASVDNLTRSMKKCIDDACWRAEFDNNAEFLRKSLFPPGEHAAAKSVLNLLNK